MVGSMHGGGPLHNTRYGRSMRGRYASYWNAFLFYMKITLQIYLLLEMSGPLKFKLFADARGTEVPAAFRHFSRHN